MNTQLVCARGLAILIAVPFLSCLTVAADAGAAIWDLQKISQPPKIYDAPDQKAEGVRGLFFEGLPYKGNPTRVFAWYGAPANPEGKKLPAMVLIHGGGGSAFIYWVKLWNSRGYAAIAMDTCGCLPGSDKGGGVTRPRHEFGGPGGWGGFDQIDAPVEDQWTYHAVADAVLAHSLIRSFPEVDPERIGVTGISWGGYLTCIVSGVDPRFKCAVPVYGCGFLGDNSTWLPNFKKMGEERAAKWLKLWDPSVYLKNAKMPLLWVTGTNDFAYPMDSLQKSYRLPPAQRTLSIKVRMPHGHGGVGENPIEIQAFADSFLKDGKPMAKIVEQAVEKNTAWAQVDPKTPIVKAELNFTKDDGVWQKRKWETVPAEIVKPGDRASEEVPAGSRVFYLNLIDDRGLVVSTEHVEVK